MLKLSDNKADWGPGPWQDEPDHFKWVDETTGLACMINRGPMGHLCGYVGVPPSHPLFGKSCNAPDDVWELTERQKFWKIHVNGIKEYLLADIEVHGGLTFADAWSEDDPNFYFGFDCAHAYDLSPKIKDLTAKKSFQEVYRDWAYVKTEVESLAKQLKAIK
jgi:hypothetical protein